MKKNTKGIIAGAVAVLAVAAVAFGLYKGGVFGGSGSTADKVYVENVSAVMNQSSFLSNSYMGVVESQETKNVNPSSDKKVEELLVKEGDEVSEGDVLFIYSVKDQEEQLVQYQFDLEGYQLQIENYNRDLTGYDHDKKAIAFEIQNLNTQIEMLKKEDNGQGEKYNSLKIDELNNQIATYMDRLVDMDTQIEQTKTSIEQVKTSISSTNAKIESTKTAMQNNEVKAPISGTIKSINEDYGNGFGDANSSYITILAAGDYRIKGKINEQNVWSLQAGTPVTVRSRVDRDLTWSGVVEKIDTENPAQDNNNNGFYMEGSAETTSTKYNFYVTLNDSTNLLLGQHVYIELGDGTTAEKKDGVWLYEYYISYEEDGTPYVWVANSRMKLEKRKVTLGEYDDVLMAYEIVSGLSDEDNICYPVEYLYEGVSCVTNMNEVDYDSPMYNQANDMGEGEFYEDMPMDAMPGDGISEEMIGDGAFEGEVVEP